MCTHIIKTMKPVLVIACVLSLTACNGFFEKDNTPDPTPLTKIASEVRPQLLWSVKTGSGTNGEYLKMSPAINETTLFATGAKGSVTAINRASGRINWRADLASPITAGPGIGDGLVVVSSQKGEVIALQQSDGRIMWKTTVPGEILAKPAIGNNIVIVKAVDGHVRALSTKDGHELWSVQQVEPNLILRGASAPLIRGHDVLVGFANGQLSKYALSDGRLFWQQPISIPEGAFAIQRMIDIDANPIVFEHHIYAATYQGRIASLDWTSGRILWTHDISSYTGMIADSNAVYISDAKSHVWAFNADSGLVNWRQTKLESRIVSGPASMGDYIVVGDAEGYLHWLSKRDGHFAGRVRAASGIYASPLVQDNVLYALTNNGYLLAYTLSR
jgi:outer membrane protein assembly factor BamB